MKSLRELLLRFFFFFLGGGVQLTHSHKCFRENKKPRRKMDENVGCGTVV